MTKCVKYIEKDNELYLTETTVFFLSSSFASRARSWARLYSQYTQSCVCVFSILLMLEYKHSNSRTLCVLFESNRSLNQSSFDFVLSSFVTYTSRSRIASNKFDNSTKTTTNTWPKKYILKNNYCNRIDQTRVWICTFWKIKRKKTFVFSLN